MRFLATHRRHVRGRHREEEHRAYLLWESGPRNHVGAAMTPRRDCESVSRETNGEASDGKAP